ncbi:hypothetical protein ACWGQ5_45005, partial [Streptomyces sp. NPDC055722]
MTPRLPDFQLQVVECCDSCDGMVGAVVFASALSKDLVVFEAGDGVFGDSVAPTEPVVVPVFDDATVWATSWCADAIAAAIPAVAGE